MITAGIGSSLGNRSRFYFDVRGKNWNNYQKIQSKNRLSISLLASSALVKSPNLSAPNFYEVLQASRDQEREPAKKRPRAGHSASYLWSLRKDGSVYCTRAGEPQGPMPKG